MISLPGRSPANNTTTTSNESIQRRWSSSIGLAADGMELEAEIDGDELLRDRVADHQGGDGQRRQYEEGRICQTIGA